MASASNVLPVMDTNDLGRNPSSNDKWQSTAWYRHFIFVVQRLQEAGKPWSRPSKPTEERGANGGANGAVADSL
jgi:hypothetical protein